VQCRSGLVRGGDAGQGQLQLLKTFGRLTLGLAGEKIYGGQLIEALAQLAGLFRGLGQRLGGRPDGRDQGEQFAKLGGAVKQSRKTVLGLGRQQPGAAAVLPNVICDGIQAVDGGGVRRHQVHAVT